MVEQTFPHNVLNVGLHRPKFVSTFSEYVLKTELPRSWKIPKFIKFVGDTNESIVEHISRYQYEARDLVNNENLKIKVLPKFFN